MKKWRLGLLIASSFVLLCFLIAIPAALIVADMTSVAKIADRHHEAILAVAEIDRHFATHGVWPTNTESIGILAKSQLGPDWNYSEPDTDNPVPVLYVRDRGHTCVIHFFSKDGPGDWEFRVEGNLVRKWQSEPSR
jgi:hypothetical protein